MIRSFDGTTPEIHESAYVDPTAVVIGDVRIGPDASVWPNVTIRGDHGTIDIAEGVNVQDNAVLHEGVELHPYTTVGHTAIVHDATVKERGLVGMGSTVLDRSVVGERAVVGANSLVTADTEIEAGMLYVGTPAEKMGPIEDTSLAETAERYVKLSRKHMDHSERVE